MTLSDGTLIINPSFDEDNPAFSVYAVHAHATLCEFTLRRVYGTIGEALAYIEGYYEQQARNAIHGTLETGDNPATRDLTDHDIAAGS